MATWKRTLDVKDVFHNDDLTLEEKRDAIVARAKLLPEYATDREYEEIIDELADVDSERYFDLVWDALYDWADANRVWVATF